MQVSYGTGPGVRRSKHPLFSSHTRCNIPCKPPEIYPNQFGNKFRNWCNVRSFEGVTVYGHVQECHVTFGRGRLQNIWWDPHIDHKTSWGQFQTFPDMSLFEDESCAALRIKHASLLWDRTSCLATPVAIFHANLPKFIQTSSVMKIKNWCNVRSFEGVTVYGHVQECHVTFGRGRLQNIWWDPHIDHKTSWGQFQTFPDMSLFEDESCAALRIKHSLDEQVLAYHMRCEIKMPQAGEDRKLLLRNGKFVIWKLKSSYLS